MRHQLSLLKLLTLFAAVGLLGRCASTQQGGDQASDQLDDGTGDSGAVNASLNGGNGTTPANKSALGEQMNNAVEGGATNNFAGTNGGNLTNGSNAENASLGAPLNNVPINNPNALITNAPPMNLPLNNTAAPLNQGATNLAQSGLETAEPSPANGVTPSNEATAAESAVASTPPAPAATSEVTDLNARAAASTFTNPQMNWPGKGKVKYVTRQLTRHSSPNGPVVGEFEQGEHPLVYQNGNWAELNDGSFVKGNGLTEKGVGYKKSKPTWR